MKRPQPSPSPRWFLSTAARFYLQKLPSPFGGLKVLGRNWNYQEQRESSKNPGAWDDGVLMDPGVASYTTELAAQSRLIGRDLAIKFWAYRARECEAMPYAVRWHLWFLHL